MPNGQQFGPHMSSNVLVKLAYPQDTPRMSQHPLPRPCFQVCITSGGEVAPVGILEPLRFRVEPKGGGECEGVRVVEVDAIREEARGTEAAPDPEGCPVVLSSGGVVELREVCTGSDKGR